MFNIVPITDGYRDFINAQIAEGWAGSYIVSRGALHDTRTQRGFAALEAEKIIGYALYSISGCECELMLLESLTERRGAGRALVDKVTQTARDSGCRRLWLVTTNDNTRSIRFYQMLGFELRQVYINAMADARKLKPQIPPTGCDGIPIKHEFEFEKSL